MIPGTVNPEKELLDLNTGVELPDIVREKLRLRGIKLNEGRLLTPEQEKAAITRFNMDPGLKRISRTSESQMPPSVVNEENKNKQTMFPYSILKADDGKLYVLYEGSDALGKGGFGSVKIAQELGTQKWVARKVQHIIKNKDYNSTLNAAYEEQKIQKLFGQFHSAQQIEHTKKMKQEDEKRQEVTTLHTIMPLYSMPNFAQNGPAHEQLSRHIESLKKELKTATNGKSLTSTQKQQKIIDQVSYIITMALNATQNLKNIHDKGVLHRDLHGGNVLVDSKGNTCIVDFGLSVQLKEGAKFFRQNPNISDTQMISRTAYRSPEVQVVIKKIRSIEKGAGSSENKKEAIEKVLHPYSVKDDIYAFGLMLQKDFLLEEGLKLLSMFNPNLREKNNVLKKIADSLRGEANKLNILVAKLQSPDKEDRPTTEQLICALQEMQEGIKESEKQLEKLEAQTDLVSCVQSDALKVSDLQSFTSQPVEVDPYASAEEESQGDADSDSDAAIEDVPKEELTVKHQPENLAWIRNFPPQMAAHLTILDRKKDMALLDYDVLRRLEEIKKMMGCLELPQDLTKLKAFIGKLEKKLKDNLTEQGNSKKNITLIQDIHSLIDHKDALKKPKNWVDMTPPPSFLPMKDKGVSKNPLTSTLPLPIETPPAGHRFKK